MHLISALSRHWWFVYEQNWHYPYCLKAYIQGEETENKHERKPCWLGCGVGLEEKSQDGLNNWDYGVIYKERKKVFQVCHIIERLLIK